MNPDRFSELWQRLIGPGAGAAYFALDSAYSDPGRHYHNEAHIEAMLDGLDRVRNEPEFVAANFDEIELAIWFHDAVYDPLAKDNEAKSADLFKVCAGENAAIGPAGVDRICTMILATTTHAPDADPSTRLLLDLDLHVLGGAEAAYRQYVQDVRTEYAAVPDEAWRAGRPAVLRRFLERPAIYQTLYFHDRLEARARENVAREIAALEA